MNEDFSKTLSLYLAIIGWVVFIIAVALFLFVMRPYYYEQGVEAGRQQQFLTDVNIIDDYLLIPQQSVNAQNTIIGRVVDLPENEVVFENITGTYNPLLVTGNIQHAIVDQTTELWKRSLRAEAELLEEQQAAELRGEDPALVSPYIDTKITKEDFSIGDRVELLPQAFGDAGNEYFTAGFITLLDLGDIQFGS